MTWIGNKALFQFLKRYEHIMIIRLINDVTISAPASKLLLSIVPLYQIFHGKPKVEDLDVYTSASLFFTGFVFTIYSTVVGVTVNGSVMTLFDHWSNSVRTGRMGQLFTVPAYLRGNFILMSVNAVMATVNGYNCIRRYRSAEFLG